MIEKKIWIKTSFKGTHNWPEATQFAGPQVTFLEAEHRHTFHIRVELEVNDSDREEEFFVLQGKTDAVINELYPLVEVATLNQMSSLPSLVRRLGRKSCEMIAEEIIKRLRLNYGYTNTITIDVSEDGEVGGTVTMTTDVGSNVP